MTEKLPTYKIKVVSNVFFDPRLDLKKRYLVSRALILKGPDHIGEEVTVTGTDLYPGLVLSIKGEWIENARYGRQLHKTRTVYISEDSMRECVEALKKGGSELAEYAENKQFRAWVLDWLRAWKKAEKENALRAKMAQSYK